jgi:hypothetical protein
MLRMLIANIMVWTLLAGSPVFSATHLPLAYPDIYRLAPEATAQFFLAADITDRDEEANMGDPDEETNIGDSDEKANIGDSDEEANVGDPGEEANIGDPDEKDR